MDSTICKILTFSTGDDKTADVKAAVVFEHYGDSVKITIPGRYSSVTLDRTDAEDVAGFLRANLSEDEVGFSQ